MFLKKWRGDLKGKSVGSTKIKKIFYALLSVYICKFLVKINSKSLSNANNRVKFKNFFKGS